MPLGNMTMIAHVDDVCFDDVCRWVSCIVDDLLPPLLPLRRRPGPAPSTGGDSKLLAMALIGESRGWDLETELRSHVAEHRDL